MKNVSDDQSTKVLDRFAENMFRRNGIDAKHHNLYLIQTYDESGNLTDEKYGMNLFTDHGLFRVNNVGNGYYLALVFGKGDVTPDYSDISMTDIALPVTPQITMSRTRYPMKYDPVTDLISIRYRLGSATLDYNLSGVTEDVEITHFGIFTNNDSGQKLMTHSKVYDANGQESSFVKRVNEKVTITIFLNGCLLSSLLSDAYNNDVYITFASFMDTLLQFVDSSYIRITYDNEQGSFNGYKYGYGADEASGRYTVPFRRSDETVDPITHERTATRSVYSGTNALITSNTMYVSSIYFNWTGGLCVHTPVGMSQPEELSCDCVYTDGNRSLNVCRPFGYPARRNNTQYVFDSRRRMDGCLPVNDFNVTSCYMWDYSTKDWTIQEQFHNPDPGKYVFVPFFKSYNDLRGDTNYEWCSSSSWKGKTSLWINDADGVGVTVFVRTNKHTNIPLKRFITDGTAMTVYGTDTYWDGSSYVKLPSYATEIPSEYRNFKYYLFTQDISARAEYIYDHPDQDIPHIVSQRQPMDITISELASETSIYHRSLKLLTSTTNGWIATVDNIVYPNAQGGPVVYSLRPYGDNRGPMKNHVLIDVENNINEVTWQSGRFDTSGTLVADSYAWYTDQIFDITGYQHLCWQGVFEPTTPRGDRIIFYLYDADENFIRLVNSTDTSSYSTALSNGIFDNLPDNVKYVRFGFWRKNSSSGSAESPTVIKQLSYCELFQFRAALNKRYATKDRIVMTNVYKCHGSETAYRPNTANNNSGMYSHCNVVVAKVGPDPTVEPEFQLINFPFHAPYLNPTASIAYSFDEYNGLFVVSVIFSSWQTTVPRKVFGVDLYGIDAGTSNPFDNDAEMFFIGDGYGCKICKQYKWCAYFDATDSHIIHAYSFEDRSEICTFTIDSAYTIYVWSDLIVLKNYIYIPCKVGSKETVILCDIDSGRWEEVEGFTSPTLSKLMSDWYDEVNDWSYTDDMALNIDQYWGGFGSIACTDGNVALLSSTYYSYSDRTYQWGTISADVPKKWTKSITMDIGSNSESKFFIITGTDDIETGVPELSLTPDGKHLLAVGYTRNIKAGFSHYAVIDIGMYLNNGQTYRYETETDPFYYVQNPNFKTAPLANSVIAYFDDGIIAYAPDSESGKFRWSPLACWLPHKVTGTTYSIQAYNNPKVIFGGSITMKISNRIPTLTI